MNLTDEDKLIREKIISNARRHAAADGLFNITVHEIVRDAGISEEDFYKFFNGIDEVINELLSTRSGLADEDALKLPLDEKIRRFNFVISMQVETAGIEKFSGWIHENIKRKDNHLILSDKEILRKLLNSSVEAGELTSDAPIDEIVEFIVSLNYGLGMNWCMTGAKFEPLEHLDMFNNLIINSLIPYIK